VSPLLLLLLTGCRHPVPDYDTALSDADGDGVSVNDDCNDDDPGVHPGAQEIPYDGLDQDCDGSDLVDVDGDGFDVHADCDDEDATVRPDAEEVAYDGVDQDCDGADLCDVDGDGFDASACGGEDCDDEAATTWLGAAEVLANAVDDDCDDRLDEVEACPDGSGHYVTIQEAADAAPDGGIVEICPGVWTEAVTLVDRVLGLEGAGEMPEETVMEPTGDYGIAIAGEGSFVEIDWLGLHGRDGDTLLVKVDDGASVRVSRTEVENGAIGTAAIVDQDDGAAPGALVEVSLSRLAGEIRIGASQEISLSASVSEAEMFLSGSYRSSSGELGGIVKLEALARTPQCLFSPSNSAQWRPTTPSRAPRSPS